MEQAQLTKRTILIFQSDEKSAAALHDRIVRIGGRALVACSLPQALLIANNEPLDDALIGFEFAGAGKVIDLLRERHVPYIFCSAESLRNLFAGAGGFPSATFVKRCDPTPAVAELGDLPKTVDRRHDHGTSGVMDVQTAHNSLSENFQPQSIASSNNRLAAESDLHAQIKQASV